MQGASLQAILGLSIYSATLREAGYVIAPLKPTDKMEKAFKEGRFQSFRTRYAAMMSKATYHNPKEKKSLYTKAGLVGTSPLLIHPRKQLDNGSSIRRCGGNPLILSLVTCLGRSPFNSAQSICNETNSAFLSSLAKRECFNGR
jgi:hypothetical protein